MTIQTTTMPRRLGALLLCLALLIGLLPTAALAADTESAEGADLTQCAGTEAPDADDSVADVQALIDALLTAEELERMSQDEQRTVYEQVQAVYDAYEALTEEQKAQITGTDVFNKLFLVLNSMVNTLADEVEEQFSTISLGATYWFDLSGLEIPGTVNEGNELGVEPVPDSSLHWVPFTYAGTIRAYVLNENSNGQVNASQSASDATDSNGEYGYTYDHSLFISDYNITHSVSWNELNEKDMIFGTSYQSGGVDYSLRVPSAGNVDNKLTEKNYGTPENNEWDVILKKDVKYNKNSNEFYFWGQDTQDVSSATRTYRSLRYMYGVFDCSASSVDSSTPYLGFHPVLEILNADTLDSNSLRVVNVELNGGKIGTAEDAVNIVVKSGESFTAPSGEGLTAPVDGAEFMGWKADDNTVYEAGASVPSTVTTLTAQWNYPAESTPEITIDYQNETLKGFQDGANYTIDGEPVSLEADGTLAIDSSWFNKSLFIVKKGDGSTTSDSAPQTLPIPARPAAPTGLASVNETRAGRGDGKITGLTAGTDYEISTDSGKSWKDAELTGTEITGLAPGTYQLRTKATTTNFASPAAEVTIGTDPYVPPYIPPTKPDGPSTGTSDGWEDIRDEIADADKGDTITIDMNGETEVPAEIFEEVAGKDVTVEFELEDGISWTVNGQDVPTGTDFSDLDLGVDMGTSGIDLDVINTVTGELGSVQITLAHDGEFGFVLTLTAPLGKENAGYWANLYHYDEAGETLNFETSAQIDGEGGVALRMTHASQYAIVIDDKSHDLPFTDLGENQWYEAAVRYAYIHDIMEGTSPTTFVPNTSLTRAEAVQVLYNLEGQPTVSESTTFPDLVEEWYKSAIAWAEQTGVVDGYENGTFRPGQPVNRMEFAQMLYNYAKYKGYDLTAQGDLTAFPDGDSVQPWAETAMTWANGNKLINGHDDGTLEPGGTTTRAQAASILMRFDQNVVDK